MHPLPGGWYSNSGSKTLAHPDFDCIARWLHPLRNGGRGPGDFTHGSREPVRLLGGGCPRCGKKHEWDAMVLNLTKLKAAHGIMYPFCDSRGRHGRFCSCRSIAADSRLLQEWHPDNPDPATVAQASNQQEYKWRCTAGRGHADYEAMPRDRSSHGNDCPACWIEQNGKVSLGRLAEQQLDLVAGWDVVKNGGPPGRLTWWQWWQSLVEVHSLQPQLAGESGSEVVAGTEVPHMS